MFSKLSKFILLSFIIWACWEKQSHEIMAPEPAHYQLSGIVNDIDLNEALDSIRVKITTIQLLETSKSFSKTTFTDAQGRFLFDTLYAGTYQIRFYRDGYEVLKKRYFQNYNDSTITFPLPDVYYIPGSKLIAKYSEFHPDYYDGHPLRMVKFSFHSEEPFFIVVTDTLGSDADTVFFRHKWDSEKRQWIRIQQYAKITEIKIGDVNICFGKNASYFYLVDIRKQILYKIRFTATYLKEEERYSLPYPANDIYYAGGKIYISALDKIYVFNEISFNFESELTTSRPDIYITSFFIDNLYIWLSDNEADLLYQCDHELNILKTYVPYVSYGIYNINELSYDFTGKDWYSSYSD